MANNSLDFLKDVMAAPLGELIASVGNGVAEAQASLDAASLSQTLELYSQGDDEALQVLRDIGYRPTFYAIPETEVEATISLALSGTVTGDGTVVPTTPTSGSTSPISKILANSGLTQQEPVSKTRVYAAPVNASNQNQFNINVNAATKLKFKIVPVPPSDAVADLRVIPDIVGQTVEDAELLLNNFQLQYFIANDSGSGIIQTQSPEAGSVGKVDDVIDIEL